jgi:hypothetical protein
MVKRPAPTEWDAVEFAFGGALLGMVVGGMFCCYQMAMHGADIHIVRDSIIGGTIGTLLVGTLPIIRNRMVRARKFP